MKSAIIILDTLLIVVCIFLLTGKHSEFAHDVGIAGLTIAGFGIMYTLVSRRK